MKALRICPFLFVILILSAPGYATVISLNFDTLPSNPAQGWTFGRQGVHAGVAEEDVFSVDGTTLFQNSIGQGNGGSGGIWYEFIPDTLPNIMFTLELRARVLENEGDPGQPLYGYGFRVQVRGPGGAYMIGFTTDRIRDYNLQTLLIDNTQFHDYRLQAVPGGPYELYRDGLLVMSGAAVAGGTPFLELGDGTGGTNARAEVTEYVFTQIIPTGIQDETPRAMLSQNYPNPFNPSTTIEYSIEERTRVSLRIYDTTGTLVRTLIDHGQSPVGHHSVTWDGKDNAGHPVASGVYVYELSTPGFSTTRKMILIK